MNKNKLDKFQSRIFALMLSVFLSFFGCSAQATGVTNAKKDWYEKEKYSNGNLKFQCKYENKVKRWCKNYFETGDIESEVIFTGKLDRSVKEYFNDGRLAKEFAIKNGTVNGVLKEYSPKTKRRFEYTILDNKREGIAKGFEKGQLILIGNFKSDLPDGIWKEFKYGQLIREIPYSNGVLNGLGKGYDQNRLVNVEIPFRNGKIDGLVSSYSNGKLKQTEFYKDGMRKWVKPSSSNRTELKFETLSDPNFFSRESSTLREIRDLETLQWLDRKH
jgi:antitoxin component YwqK of YwqJK toxin-antitoxin module